MLNSTIHDICHVMLINVKMPTIDDVLEQIKFIIRQADLYDKTGDTAKRGRGCKI